MNLLDSLLDAIIRLDGDALVMHVGEKPYVVTTSEADSEFRGPLVWGQVELSSRVLTAEAVRGMLAQFLPAEHRDALTEYGATECPVRAASNPAEAFTIVAARGGDDIWLEIRRQEKLRIRAEILRRAEAAGRAAAEDPSEAKLAAAAAQTPEAGRSPAMAADDPPPSAAAPETAWNPTMTTPYEEHEVSLDPLSLPSNDPDPAAASPMEDALDPAALGEVARAYADSGEWTDDVMTEGDLNALLSASASASLLGETARGLPLGAAPAGVLDDLAAFDLAVEPDAEPFDPFGKDLMAHAGVDETPEADGATAYAAAPAAVPEGSSAPPPLTPAELAVRAAHDAFEAAERTRLADEAPSAPAAAVPAPAVPSAPAVPAPAVPAASVPAPAVPSAPVVSAPAAHVPDVAGRSGDGMPEHAGGEVSAPQGAPLEPESPHLSEGRSMSEDVRVEAPLADSVHETAAHADHPHRPAIVLPLTRQVRADGASDARGGAGTVVQRLLRAAAARGAGTLYVVAGSAPMLRIDGEFSALEGEAVLPTAAVERLLSELMPAARDTGSPVPSEWVADVPEVGRVRGVAFRDHRGPGVIFRLVTPKAISADGLGLPAEVQAFCAEADGLVLVAGGRGSGRSTLLASFVDLINRNRGDHVIVLQTEIGFVHDLKRSFISQREVRGTAEAMAAAVRAALREDPDVLVIEEIRTPELLALALEAAESGRLVIGSVPAASTGAAVERILEMVPAERREKAQAALAAVLRGIVSQVLLRRLHGGHVAAREVLINTPAVAALIAEGKAGQLASAVEQGRRYGMMTSADSIAALVRDGVVHPAHALRKAPDRELLAALLRRDGVDTSIAERLG